MNELRLITFDLDDTLWPVEPVMQGAEKVLGDWLAERVPEYSKRFPPRVLLQFVRDISRQRPDLDGFVSRKRLFLLQAVLTECGLSEAQCEIMAQQAFEVFLAARQQVQPYPGAVAALSRLSECYALCAVSNGNADIRQTPFSPYFADAISAESCGFPKPDPRIFQLALDRFGVSAAECVHIGDHPDTDVQAAMQAGLHAIWINREQAQWPARFAEPTAVIRDFDELDQALVQIKNRIH